MENELLIDKLLANEDSSNETSPLNIHNVGILFRNFFDKEKHYFDLINNAHEFQSLSESNKPAQAYRKGIYLSNVEETKEGIEFNLLRCSSNLQGPTDNFRDIDKEIIARVNKVSNEFFKESVELNHVLAQIYKNVINENGKQSKAKIKEHSDKTKDMDPNGLIAFCTFYKNFYNNQFTGSNLKHIKLGKDGYDYVYKKTSVLTKLRFRLKGDVNDETLVKKFDVILYPNSVFIMSLKANRCFTHEIVPSTLSIDKISERLGYVLRRSGTKAIHKNNQTYIIENGNEIPLKKITQDDMNELRKLYSKENFTSQIIEYPPIYFSMNKGDYECPII